MFSVDIIGSEILNTEIIRGGRATVPFFAVGFVIMSVFVLTSVIGSALYFNQMDNGWFAFAIIYTEVQKNFRLFCWYLVHY